MAHNAASEQQVKKAEEAARLERVQELEDIKTLLAVPSGKRFFKRFFDKSMLMHSCMTGNSMTFFNLGVRNVALWVFADICEASPDKIAEVMVRSKEEPKAVASEDQE